MLFLGKRSNESLDEPRDLKVKREKELGRLFRSSNWPGLPEIAPAMHSGLHLSGERHRICGKQGMCEFQGPSLAEPAKADL